MPFELPELPFAYDALDPYMSAETFEFHHDKHHQAYVTNGNKAILDIKDHMGKTLEEIVANALKTNETGLFNNAAQHWNHSFFWNCLKPGGGGTALPGTLQSKIDSDLGGYDEFKAKFVEACVTQFGSGWGWLAYNPASDGLAIQTCANQDPLSKTGLVPLMGVDVWEHAYYLQYKNVRPSYLEAIWNVIDFDCVAARLAAAKK